LISSGRDAKKQIEIYTDALLTAHEMEIRRLQLVLEERAPMINMIEKHRSLVGDREQLALSANDSSRLISRGGFGNRDPTRLLREERMRKRIAKELPKIEVELKKTLEDWEEEHGEPFLVNGEDYLQTLTKMSPLPAPVARDVPKPGRWNPPATGSIQRARSNTASSTAPRPVSRAKTPNAPQIRSKTPTGGPTMTMPAPSIGRSSGRNMAVTVHRSGAKTPGPGGRIPQTGTVPRSPNRTRAPLSIFPEGSNSPDRRAPPSLVRSQSAKSTQRGALSAGPGNISKVAQLMPPPSMVRTPQNTIPPYLRQQQERDRQRISTTSNISREGTVKSVRSVSPEDLWDTDGENRGVREVTPRPKSFPPRAVGYSYEREESSSNGDSESTRLFSGSSTGTTASSTGNWEAFGDETEDEGSVADDEDYYGGGYGGYSAKQRGPGSVVARSGGSEDEWLSEATGSRY
jgi:protein regulator of cytokinesis 1